MSELMAMANIGKILAEKLEKADIHTPEALAEVGAEDAFLRIRSAVDPDACLHMLYALQGAAEGKRYTLLPAETKARLQRFYQALKN